MNNNKNYKNDHYAMMLIFQKKCERPGGGGSLEIRTHADKGGKKWAKIFGRS